MEHAAIVRRAVPEDADAFAACQYACWEEAYSTLWDADRFARSDQAALADQRRREMSAGGYEHWLADLEGQIVGIAAAGPPNDDAPTPLELFALYVREAHYGTGVATQLLNAATGTSPTSLWVYRDNPRASAFYVNQGFIPDGAERIDPSGILELRFTRR